MVKMLPPIPVDTLLVSRKSCSVGNRSMGFTFSLHKDELIKLAGTTMADGYIIIHQKHRGDDKCFTGAGDRYRLAYKNEALKWVR